MCRFRGQRDWEETFPHHNWILIVSLQMVITCSWSVPTPSIYQFITTPRSLSEELRENREDTDRFWPGLGGSETDYAWAKTLTPLFEVITMPFAAVIVKRIPYTATILLALSLFAVGGSVYALASNVWMIFVGNSLLLVATTLGAVPVHVYMGEIGTVLDEIRRKQEKKPIKFIIYITYTFINSSGVLASSALTSAMAQFSNLSPYRWPGWFITVFAIVYAIALIFCFTETPSLFRAKPSPLRCSCGLRVRVSEHAPCKIIIRFLTYLFLTACAYMVGQLYAPLLTLVTPVLSDSFGFSVKYTSYFLTMLSVASFSSCFIQLGTKLRKMDNRHLLGLFVIFALFGSVLVGDWQSIGHNPCYSLYRNDTSQPSNNSSNSSIICESLSSSSHQCFWNPESRITGEFCNTCLDTCLSKQKSQSIYQFSFGMLFLALAAPLGIVFVSAIAADITSSESQDTYLSLVLGSGATARTVSPYWSVESYLWTERHTYFFMAVSAGFALVLLFSLAALYKNLAPIPTQKRGDPTVSATSKLAVLGERASDVETELPTDVSVHASCVTNDLM